MSFGVRCKATLFSSTFVNFGTDDVTSNVGDSGFSSSASGWSKSSPFGEIVWLAESIFVGKTGVSDGGVDVTLFGATAVAKSRVSTLQNRCDAAVNQWSATPGLPPLGVTTAVTSSLFKGCWVRELIWKDRKSLLFLVEIRKHKEQSLLIKNWTAGRAKAGGW